MKIHTGEKVFTLSFNMVAANPEPVEQCFFLTKGSTFHVTANFYVIGFLTGWSYFSMSMFLFDKGSSLSCDGQFLHHRFFDGWSYFSMSFDWLAAKVDCDQLSFGM